MKKLRWSEVLEVLALVLGSGLLLYFSCGDEAAPVARDGKVFLAPRPAGGAAAPGAARARVEGVLRELLAGVAAGRVTEAARGDVQVQLAGELAAAGWGEPEQRGRAAAVIVQQVFDQAKLSNGRSGGALRQRQAIQGMAKELTRQIILLAKGVSPGADAIVTALPEGHERVTWNQLGGFAYVPGDPLPAAVRALDGRRVALPGFMLTLGDGDDDGIGEFVLVESLWGCCFGAVPELNQTVLVRPAADRAVPYAAGPLLVTGVMEVGEEREGEFVTSLYRIRDAAVHAIDDEVP